MFSTSSPPPAPACVESEGYKKVDVRLPSRGGRYGLGRRGRYRWGRRGRRSPGSGERRGREYIRTYMYIYVYVHIYVYIYMPSPPEPDVSDQRNVPAYAGFATSRALFLSKVDRFVPHSKHINLRVSGVGTDGAAGDAAAPAPAKEGAETGVPAGA